MKYESSGAVYFEFRQMGFAQVFIQAQPGPMTVPLG